MLKPGTFERAIKKGLFGPFLLHKETGGLFKHLFGFSTGFRVIHLRA